MSAVFISLNYFQQIITGYSQLLLSQMVPPDDLEPPTLGASNQCSPSELQGHNLILEELVGIKPTYTVLQTAA